MQRIYSSEIFCSNNTSNANGLKPGFHSNAIACVCCVNENRKKRKRLRWQAANHGCHCFDRALLLAGACVYWVQQTPIGMLGEAVATMIGCLPTQAIAFEWKLGLTYVHIQ